jgi:Na+/glutamate symporter
VTLTGGHGSSVAIIANFAEDTAPTAVPAAPVISATDGTYEDRESS